ncbi:fms-related tyrosine kinase 3 ligand isoform X2 [Microcaecilia unicolor]|nr:fms-related tyrosine kinase 3 ligand isoform X2 [Microcaecilia unicolor]XP_030053789.1 fms-related tyrosine kinase 3 ligand isoform X2 [Microcaecilia unicolor]
MIKYHACQDILSHAGSVTLRLFPVAALLLVSLLDPSHSCHFKNPISTTFDRQIKNLSKWLLLDYPISITSNLKPDSWCSELWQLQLMKKELERMRKVAGEELSVNLEKVRGEIAFLGSCTFTVSTDCLTGERTNASNFLRLLEQQISVLKSKLTGGQKPLDFSNCTQIMCMPVQMTGSDSMTTTGLSQPAKDRRHHEEKVPPHQEDHRPSSGWISASSEAGSRPRRTPENKANGYARGSTALVDSKDWLKRAHAWLCIPILFLVSIILVIIYWCIRSLRKTRNSVSYSSSRDQRREGEVSREGAEGPEPLSAVPASSGTTIQSR